MKVKFNDWEIDIKATNTLFSEGEEKDTKIFLNFLSILYENSATLLKHEAKEAIKTGKTDLAEIKIRVAAIREGAAFEIYHALAATGLYDDIIH